VKNAYSNFSDIHSYLLNEKKKRRRKREIPRKAREISSVNHVIRLPLTRTSRLSCPNELSSTTSYSSIKKKKLYEPLILLQRKKTNTLIITNMTTIHTFDISLQLSSAS